MSVDRKLMRKLSKTQFFLVLLILHIVPYKLENWAQVRYQVLFKESSLGKSLKANVFGLFLLIRPAISVSSFKIYKEVYFPTQLINPFLCFILFKFRLIYF